MKNMFAAVSVAALAGAGFAQIDDASSIQSGLTFEETEIFGPDTPTFAFDLVFDQYDQTTFGTLQSIEVILELNITGGSATVDNDGVDGGLGEAQIGADAAISSIDVPLISGGFPFDLAIALSTAQNNIPLTGDDGDGSNAQNGGGDEFTLPGADLSDNASDFIDVPSFVPYIGTSDFTITVDAGTIFNVDADTGVEGGFSPVDASGSVTVIYTFVPTPGAAGLLAVAGLAAARRRRRA